MIALDQTFDSEFGNKIARLESYNKHLYRPNTYLHKWWARRCGTTFRLILKQLAQNDLDRDFYTPGGLDGLVILDPMMGGGTTVHEAIRLGANVIGFDVDPIPILQARASLSGIPSDDLEGPFLQLVEAIRQDLEPVSIVACPTCQLQDSLRYTLYGLQRYCQCGPAIHVDSLVLRHEGNQAIIRFCSHCHQVHDVEQCPNHLVAPSLTPVFDKTVQKCAVCKGAFKEELDKPYYSRYTALVSAGVCAEHGPFFKGVEERDIDQIRRANAHREGLNFYTNLTVVAGPKSNDLLRRGIKSYKDLFSSRQLIYLKTAIDHLNRIDPDIRLPLALLVSTSLEFNSMLCGYKGAEKRRAGAIRHAFSHHAYSFPYTALENNPLYPSRSSGTLRKLFYDRVIQARKWAALPRERNISGDGKKFAIIQDEVDSGIEVDDPAELTTGNHKFYLRQTSSVSLNLADGSVDFVVTDPPYYDSVEYGDLSAFFRVWLRQLVRNGTDEKIDWDYEVPHFVGDRTTSGQVSETFEYYVELMYRIFAECHRVMRKDNARLVFTFHHWKADSWAALTIALRRASFALINRYVVHSENPISVHINNLRALTDDAILVLAPTSINPSPEWVRPTKIKFSSSAEFCADCGSLVGWLLESSLSDEQIRATWQESLAGK